MPLRCSPQGSVDRWYGPPNASCVTSSAPRTSPSGLCSARGDDLPRLKDAERIHSQCYGLSAAVQSTNSSTCDVSVS